MPRKIIPLPTQARLQALLEYDEQTGVFKWRERRGATPAGTVAGAVHSSGYRYIAVDGVAYKAHRLAWVYVYGRPPEDLLDHRDRNPDNNAIDNLREATHAQNQQNKKVYRNNQSGHKGVSWFAQTGRWRVRLQTDGVNRCLGYFPTLEEAVAARQQAELSMHSHRVEKI